MVSLALDDRVTDVFTAGLFEDEVALSIRRLRPRLWLRPSYDVERREYRVSNPLSMWGASYRNVTFGVRPVWLLSPEEARYTGTANRRCPPPFCTSTPTHMAFDGDGLVIMDSPTYNTWPGTGTIGVFARFDDALDQDQVIWSMVDMGGRGSPRLTLRWYYDGNLALQSTRVGSLVYDGRIRPHDPYLLAVRWDRGVITLFVCDMLRRSMGVRTALYDESTARRGECTSTFILGGNEPNPHGGLMGIAGDPFITDHACPTNEIEALTGCEFVHGYA